MFALLLRPPPDALCGVFRQSHGPLTEKIDPETLAYTLVEHAADLCGEVAADAYLVRVVAEVFAIPPGVLYHVVDKLMTDLKEEIAWWEDPRFSHATIALIETIEDEWRNGD